MKLQQLLKILLATATATIAGTMKIITVIILVGRAINARKTITNLKKLLPGLTEPRKNYERIPTSL